MQLLHLVLISLNAITSAQSLSYQSLSKSLNHTKSKQGTSKWILEVGCRQLCHSLPGCR